MVVTCIIVVREFLSSSKHRTSRKVASRAGWCLQRAVCAWQVNTEEWPWEVFALLGYLALFRLCIYVSLRRNTVLR